LSGRMRGSPRVTVLVPRGKTRGREVGVMRKKRKVVMAIVPARKRELGLLVHTSLAVAEVDRQHPGLE
jgi:hypothetical protein